MMQLFPDFKNLGRTSSCGDATATDCTLADSCDGAGNCHQNHLPLGTPCQDDSVCTLGDVCGTTGQCDGGGSADCSDTNACTQDSCDPALGCINAKVPRTTTEGGGTCRVATSTALSLKVFNDGSGLVKWRWEKGQATPLETFGIPNLDTTYTLCVYDSVGGVYTLPARRVDEPNDGKQVEPGSGWGTPTDRGWRYKNTRCDQEGIAGLTLVPGASTEPRITLKAEGPCNTVPLPCSDPDASLPCAGTYFQMDPAVVVQLTNDDTSSDPLGQCWHSGFGDADTVFKNEARKFKSKRNVRVPLPD